MTAGFRLTVLVAFGATAWVAHEGQSRAQRALWEMAERAATVQAMQTAQLEAVSSVRNAALMSNARSVKAEMETYASALKRLQAAESAFSARQLDVQSRAMLDASVSLRKSTEPIVAEAIEHVLALSGEEGARVLSTKLTPIQIQWMKQLQLLASREKALAEAEVRAIETLNARRMVALASALLGVLVAGAGGAIWFARSVTRHLRRAVEVSQRVADGDLVVQINAQGGDETAALLRSLQAMASQLSTMVRAVRESAQSVGDSSRDINLCNKDLSTRTEQQAAALQQTSAALTELASTLSDSTANTENARSLAEQTAAAAGAAGEAARKVVATMSRISESSKRVTDIIGVIDGIAFQTNILALNAAVEAARAGEQGRGFAVVAGEVRALSQRVKEAASEVRTLIAESVVRVDDGSRQVGDMGSTMQSLVASTSEVKGFLEAIATASHAQQLSIDELNTAMRGVDAATQQNAALVEHVAAAAGSLVAQTESLNSFVGRFQLPEDATRPPESNAPCEPLEAAGRGR